jgi:hypothetical protein
VLALPPSARALRLVCRTAAARPPAPPLGARAFTDDATADVAVLLDVDPRAPMRAQVDAAAAQLPDPRELPRGRLVVVLAEPVAARPLLERLFGGRASISRAARATALLARGYRRIGAAFDAATRSDVVWGEA